jgi:tetratricopeptide (TPR) repeat protein
LANIGDLKVISRTSVEKFRKTKLTLPAIADSLGVKWIVEGNVQKDGEEVEINAKLIDPSTDTPNWTGTYQRDLNAEDIFAIQGAIAREIASALQVQLSLDEQKRITGAPTQNLKAYQLYVKGRQLFHRASNRKEQLNAISYYKKALRKDTTFALAWTGLADAIGAGLFENFSLDSLSLPDITQHEAAKRALQLAPDLAEAHTSMGIVYLEEGNGPKAVKQLQKAIALKPSYWEAHNRLGEFYLKTGQPEEALEHLKIVVELNPQHRRARHFLYDAYLITGQAEKSLEVARQQQRLGLEKLMAIGGEIRALYVLDRYEQALKLAKEQLEKGDSKAHFLTFVAGSRFDNYIRSYLVSILAAKGDTVEAQKHLKQLQADNNAPPVALAIGYASLEKIDKAIESFQKVLPSHWRRIGPSADLRYGHVYNSAPLKSDPRYRDLIREANRAWGLNPDGSFPDEYNIEIANGQ